MTTPDPIVTAAKEVLAAWAKQCPDRGCEVCGNTPDADGCIDHGRGCYTQSEDGGGSSFVELTPMEAAVRALSAALDAAAPGKPGAVPEGVAVFHCRNGLSYVVYPDKTVYYIDLNDGKYWPGNSSGDLTPAEWGEHHGELPLTPDETAAFFAQHGTPLHGAPGAGGGAK